MLKNEYAQSNVSNWIKWSFVVICLIIVSCLIYSVFLYKDIQNIKNEGMNTTEQTILNNTDVVSIEKIIRFHGDQAYHVVFGATAKEEKQIIFVPLSGKDKNFTVINEQEILQKQFIEQQWFNQCQHCELVKIIPALVNQNALWEVTYFDDLGRYVLDYYSIYDGSLFEQLRFKRMFN